MRDLPPGWAWTTLGEIGEYLNGRGFKKSEWRDSGRPIIRIQNLTGTSSSFNYFDGEPDERYTARAGDLLVSWAATLGVFVWSGPEAVVNQHIFKVRSYIDRGFHRYLLLATLDALRGKTHGSGIVHITKTRFDETRVALPPLNEQQRTVATLDEQLSRVDAADQSLHRSEQRLEQLKTALLADAIKGDWPTEPLSSVVVSLRNGIFVSRPAVGPPGTPIFRISAVRPLALDVEDIRYAPESETLHPHYLVSEGDLLFTRYSGNPEYVGACARVRRLPRPTLHPDKLIRVVVDRERVEPAFVELACATGVTRAAIRSRRKTTAGQVGIAGGQLKSVPIPLPPLDEQRRVVAEVEQQLSLIAALRDALEKANRRSASLRRSILQRAFLGELVTHDPDDEPATALLQRIADERAAAAPRRRRTAPA